MSKVAVLMGGPSEEHAISLKSGQGVAEALGRRNFTVEPIFIGRSLSVDSACSFARESLIRSGADTVFIALHGQFGEDGTLQQLCEDLHLAYVGSNPQASRLGMDKAASRRLFEKAGLSVPKWCIADKADIAGQVVDRSLQLPFVVKPSDQGSSIGVSLVRSLAELPQAIFAAGQFGKTVIIEEFVEGREVTAAILGDRALPVVEIKPHNSFFDFTAKYTTGATDYLVPAPLPDSVSARVKEVGLKAHQVLGCRHMSRSDLILRSTGEPVLLEVNTIPGFTPTSLLPKAAHCAGLSYESLCEQLVAMARQPFEGASSKFFEPETSNPKPKTIF